VAGKRDFFTGSTRIISDPRPSGLDLRVYACVSMHDGMSLKKGTGRGCYATFATLTDEIGSDASNLSKSLKRLVEWGYLKEERQTDRRRKTYRVVFDYPEGWRNDQQSMVGETANNQAGDLPSCNGQATPKDVGNAANHPAEIVGNGIAENGGIPLQDEQHYSSLKELDPSEEEKLDPFEKARFAARRLAGKSRKRMPPSKNEGAQLAMFERAWKASAYTIEQVVEWHAWLKPFSEDPDPDDPNNQRANRLYVDVDYMLWENQAGPYAEGEAA
jgi:hypothetical protein